MQLLANGTVGVLYRPLGSVMYHLNECQRFWVFDEIFHGQRKCAGCAINAPEQDCHESVVNLDCRHGLAVLVSVRQQRIQKSDSAFHLSTVFSFLYQDLDNLHHFFSLLQSIRSMSSQNDRWGHIYIKSL